MSSQSELGACPVCQATESWVETGEYEEDTQGQFVCSRCNTLSQSLRDLVQEEVEKEAPLAIQRGVVTRRVDLPNTRFKAQRALAAAALARLPLVHYAFNTGDFLAGVQGVLQRQVQDVGAACKGVDAGALGGVVKGMWRRYLERWAASPCPPAHVLNGRLFLSSSDPYWGREAALGHTPPTIPPLTMTLLLGFVYAGVRWLNLPILPGDLAGWAGKGEVTYFRALGVLTPRLRAVCAVAHAWFHPHHPPSGVTLERCARVVAFATLGLHTLPPLPMELLCGVLVNRLRLPATVNPIAMALVALEDGDRATWEERGWSSKGVPLGFLPLRESLYNPTSSVPSPARLAAILFIALRLHVGWETWVQDTLAPGASLVPPPPPPPPPPPLNPPATTTQSGGGEGVGASGHAVLTSLANFSHPKAPELLKTHLDLLSQGVLQGGDAGFGRATTGYPPLPLHRDVFEVDVSDLKLKSLLVEMGEGGGRVDGSSGLIVAGVYSSSSSSSSSSGSGSGGRQHDPTVSVKGVKRERHFGWDAVCNSKSLIHDGEGVWWDSRHLEEVQKTVSSAKGLGVALKGGDEKEKVRGKEEEEEEDPQDEEKALKEDNPFVPEEAIITVGNPTLSLGAPSITLHPRLPQASYGENGRVLARRPLDTMPLRQAAALTLLCNACQVSHDEALAWVDYLEILMQCYTPAFPVQKKSK